VPPPGDVSALLPDFPEGSSSACHHAFMVRSAATDVDAGSCDFFLEWY
jgi:hypothetical protein